MGKRIVVTGARGYIGRALAAALAAGGHELRLVTRANGILDIERSFCTNVEWIEADLRNELAWHPVLEGVDVVVHLSSRTDLRLAEQDPAGDEVLNVDPVRALARAAARTPKPVSVVFASTVTIFGRDPVLPADECTPAAPCSIYDRHKLACETILRQATKDGVLRGCSLRLSNVYGYGGESVNLNRGVLNGAIRKAIAGESLAVYGDGSYVRDFIHNTDVVDAFICAIQSERIYDGSHYVIASGRGYRLVDAFGLVAETISARTGQTISVRFVPEPNDLQAIERRDFVGTSRVFSEMTGWSARVDLRSGIVDYVERVFSARNKSVNAHMGLPKP